MSRPYIICHMLISIDGKVTGQFLSQKELTEATNLYYEKNRTITSNGFICGRVTMEDSFTNGYYPDLTKYQNVKMAREDFLSSNKNKYERFAVAFDRKGRLGWTNSVIMDEDPGYNNTHIIEVLTEDVKLEYLAYLQDLKVSYIFAGKEELNLALALEKLKKLFNIDVLLLEGGSIINGAFLKAGLVDELSLVCAPIIGEKGDKPLFYDSNLTNFELVESQVIKDILYLRYKVKR